MEVWHRSFGELGSASKSHSLIPGKVAKSAICNFYWKVRKKKFKDIAQTEVGPVFFFLLRKNFQKGSFGLELNQAQTFKPFVNFQLKIMLLVFLFYFLTPLVK